VKLIKISIVLFLILFTTHAFGKSNEYYKTTLIHVLTECNSKCQKQIFEQEIQTGIFVLIDSIIFQLKYELSSKQKRFYD